MSAEEKRPDGTRPDSTTEPTMHRIESLLWVVIPIAIGVVLAIVYWPR